jgi:hypothetical protein
MARRGMQLRIARFGDDEVAAWTVMLGHAGNVLMPHRDFVEIRSAFNDERVEYLVVDACALAAHGLPRATGDIDLWVTAPGKRDGLASTCRLYLNVVAHRRGTQRAISTRQR